MEHQAGIIAAAAQWSNEQGSVIYEGVDVRLVKKDWNPAVMGLCELDEWFSFENYADFLFFWFTPGTDFDCEEEAPSLSKVRDTSKWAAAGHPGRVAWVSDGATAFDSVTGTCAARNVGVVIHAGMPWGSQGEELPQFAKGKLSLQQTVSHELTHVLLGHQHLGPSGDDYMQALLDAATTSTDLRSMCPDPWADHATYKQLSLLTGIYPSGGDPGWAVGGQGLGPSARVDPHAYTCLSNLYDDDPSGTFTNLMLYRWKPQGTPSGTEDPLEAWTSHATVDPSRWVADENLLATAEGANLEPIVAAKVTDIAGATDVKVRWYLTGRDLPCQQGYPLMHPDRTTHKDVGEATVTLDGMLRSFGVVPDDFATCGVPAGEYVLCAMIDPDCEVDETDEDDNTVYSEGLFLVTPQPGNECRITSGYAGPMLDVAAGENCGVEYASPSNPLWEESPSAYDCIDDDTDPSCDTSSPAYSMDAVGTLEGYTEGRPHQYQSSTLAGVTDGDGAADAVVAFTAPAADDYVFDTHGSNFDAGLWVTSALTGGTETAIAAAGRDRGLIGAQLVLSLAADEVAYLVVDGDPRSATYAPYRSAGDFRLNVAELQATEGDCNDGRDLDDDGLIDCADGDCWLDAWCLESCDNDLDDNGDGRIDCVDPICSADPGCVSSCPLYTADTVPHTLDGTTAGQIDSYQGSCDYDYGQPEATLEFTAPAAGTYVFDTQGSDPVGSIYLRDGCTGVELTCGDQSSVSVDGSWHQVSHTLAASETVVLVVDGAANSSFTVHVAEAEASETDCDDGRDLDADGVADCLDDDCALDGWCRESNCTDGIDNDGGAVDLLIDCHDPDCAGDPACEICDDGIDNDGNSLVDCDDPDCDLACVEVCDDGIDNDGDNDVDCDDADCAAACLGGCPNVVLSGTLPIEEIAENVGAGDEFGSGICYTWPGGEDLTFEFTAPAADTYTFSTEGSTFDTQLYALDGGCLGAEIGCSEDVLHHVTPFSSELDLVLAAGQTVVLVVDSGDGGNGQIILEVSN